MASIEGSDNADVEASIDALVTSTVGISATKITTAITVTDRETGAIDMSATAVENASSRDLILVEIEVEADAVSYTPGRILNGGTLRGQCAMRKE